MDLSVFTLSIVVVVIYAAIIMGLNTFRKPKEE
jgi:hypothetical protein